MPIKFSIQITSSAKQDVEEIWTYIANDSRENASKFIAQLENQVIKLSYFPMRCPLITENELLGTNYRHLIYEHYRTIIRITGDTVFVLRIIHGSRLLDASMFEK
ncbi:MAG: type II toxin-antitoxin system RelE/ParE family toxin [Elusimicrobiota bacterium]